MGQMKLRLGSKTSDIIITIYVIITLVGRIYIESIFKSNFINSLFMGFLNLFILWALIKIKILNPVWFGLFNKKSK